MEHYINDPEILPAPLAAKSLDPSEIVLPYPEALEAIDYLATQGYFTIAWEGWIKLSDGRMGHSRDHQGTHEFWGTKGKPIPERIQESAGFARRTIEEHQQEWNNKTEISEADFFAPLELLYKRHERQEPNDKTKIEGSTLYFCLSVQSGDEDIPDD